MEIAIAARGKEDAIAQLRVTASKLVSEKFPWKPNVGKTAIYGGELVEIVGFENGGKKFQVELASGKKMYVTKDKLECPL